MWEKSIEGDCMCINCREREQANVHDILYIYIYITPRVPAQVMAPTCYSDVVVHG